MDRSAIVRQFQDLNIWKKGAQRAPHKPLLILLALGQWVQYRRRRMAYETLDPLLRELLSEFGPQRKSYHTEYPFWRLQNDGLWLLENIESIGVRKGNTDAKKSELLRLGTTGGFPDEFYKAFEQDPLLVFDVSQQILEAHFPETMHQDILQAVGLQDLQMRPARKRDGKFRHQVLIAYEQRCAICGFDIRIGNALVGIEAAHIMWHQAGGPDEPDNGVALCTLHHKLLDRGAYTISQEYKIQVSEHVHGSKGFEDWLLQYHGKQMRKPVSTHYHPNVEYIHWHHREVFRVPARQV